MSHTTSPLAVSDDASLDDLLALAGARYHVRFEPVTVGDTTLELLQIADMEALIDRLTRESGDGPLELPFWAKIWPTSILLSHFLGRLEPETASGQQKTMLEIGAGVGICGLFAAARGVDVTITDIHPDALLFCRINVLKNGLSANARVCRADFSADRLGRRFDYIIGSEVLYLEDLHRPLVKFLSAHLSLDPEAEILLARDYHRKAPTFFRRAAPDYDIAERTLGYKETTPPEQPGAAGRIERQLTTIIRMRAKKHA
ncbi:methyltransferase [Desulfovibrio sulfodismutans]|uniref:Methyltransferase n=1 Tax=Desulfolutivibrio sulfodismutans TaxID=63561 RepID=A0A7K3NN74_9BACT|nr:methyltransferase [Desulfolutivibrio sulfodismutans]NDY57577.1 methyltransferase [Desulfolutivibrio sulfodismutans]QLA11102.1 methyltransferase [Desulfolutivibrio sulfodismutans DSM 3696]